MSKIKPVKAWAGIVDGKIGGWEGVRYGYAKEAEMPALFKSRYEAQARFEYAIPVEIRPLPRKKRGRKQGRKNT